MTSLDLVRSINEVELPEPTVTLTTTSPSRDPALLAAFGLIEDARTRAFTAVDTWVCRAPGQARESQLEQARRRLVADAAAARTRGIALTHARRLAGESGARWVARRLDGGPWPSQQLDEGMEELLGELVTETRRVASLELRRPAVTFELLTRPDHCMTLALR
jgi:hypothetical protein